MALTRVTTHGIKDGEIHSVDIANDAVTADKLDNTGVTAGSYGSSSAIPSLTIDAQGRVTSASTTSIDSTSIANGTSNVSVAASGDITVTQGGTTVGTFTGNSLDLNDDISLRLGSAQDLRLRHDGSNSFIEDLGTGGLYIRGASNIGFRDSANSFAAFADFTSGGAADLYYNGSKKFETTSGGVTVTGSLIASANVEAQNNMHVTDGKKYQAGAANDLTMYHNGTDSFIDNATGDLYIRGIGDDLLLRATDDIFIQPNGNDNGITVTGGGAVTLHHASSAKLATKSDGVDVTGEVQCDSLDVDGSSDFAGDCSFRGGASAVQIEANSDIRLISGTWTGEHAGKIQHHSNWLYFQAGSNGIVFRGSNGSDRAYLNSGGHFQPGVNNTYDLGTSSVRWRNVYTNDLNLSNEGSANDIDGTWGNFTIQEGEDDLFLINRRNGKKYKFNLTEVS